MRHRREAFSSAGIRRPGLGDLAIQAMLAGAISPYPEPITHGGALVDELEKMVRGACGRMAVAA